MRSSSTLRPLLFSALFVSLVVGAAAACSSSSTTVGPDTDGGASSSEGGAAKDASEDTSTAEKDAGKDVEEPLTVSTEAEPNDGNTLTEVNAMKLPGTMKGKLDPANDKDIFSIDYAAGDFWEWTLTGTTADLAPHLTVFDTTANNLNPTVLVAGTAGSPTVIQHFVLRPGKFVAAVRDSRNVPSNGGKGGPTFGYELTARRKTPSPVSVTFPATKTGKLASLGAVDLYTFTGTSGKGFDIIVRAERKVSPSTLDSRLSLFDLTAKKALITNDNAAGTTDSQVGSADAAPSTYLVIVENEGTNPADLSYEIEFALRP